MPGGLLHEGQAVTQDTPSSLQVEPVQTDETQLKVTPVHLGLDYLEILLKPVNTTAPTVLSVSNVSAESAQLALGVYIMQTPVDIAFRQGNSGQTAVFATDRVLYANCSRIIIVTGTADRYVAAISSAAADTGVVRFEKIGDLPT